MPGSKIVNEFDAMKKKGGNYAHEFKIKLSELSKENKNVLMNKGIQLEKIQVIKSLENISPENITDAQARLAAASMAFRITKNYLNSTEASFSCYWAWDSAPLDAYKDILAFAWTAGYTVNTSSRSKMTVRYEDIYGTYVGTRTFSVTPKASAAQFVFEQSYYSPGIRGLSSGSAVVVMDNREGKNYIEVVGDYGHSKSSLNPSFTIGWPSIYFSTKVVSMDDDYLLMEY